jgi:hypothetical protein
LVEQAFRCLKGIDLLVRPFHHRTGERVRSHILLCMLAFYVEWHLRQVWEPLLFEDEELVVDRPRRDPVRPARASAAAVQKKKTHTTPEGLPVHSLRTLLAHRGTRSRHTCVVTGDPSQTTFRQLTEADMDLELPGRILLTGNSTWVWHGPAGFDAVHGNLLACDLSRYLR